MSSIGYYRVKKNVTVDTDVTLFINNVLESTKKIKVLDWCDGNKKLKYLNKDGQYRFAIFNKHWEGRDKSKELGKANKIVTSILTSQSAYNNIGKTNERTLSLRADSVSSEQLEYLKDIYTSPRVFLYVGDGTTDIENDYVQVKVNAKNPITNIRKGNFANILIDIILPEHYTISMI